MNNFEGKERLTIKMNITFFMKNGAPNIILKFFLQKSLYRQNESQKTNFGGTFSPISVVLLGRLFPKTIGLTMGGTASTM